jgi:DNA-binding GntR family transcriptional regulator
MSQDVEIGEGQAPLQLAIRWLEHAIWSGDLAPGERIAESTIAARFGVGRGPLREALRTLEGRRLLERTPFSGVRVVQLSDEDLQQLLITREALEGMAARQAAENMTLPQIRRLRELLAKARALGSADQYFREKTPDSDFHTLIAKGSGNRWLAEFLCKDMYSLLNICRYRAAAVPERIAVVRDQHEAILDAIARREPDLAERLMREHIAGGRESLASRLRARAAAA